MSRRKPTTGPAAGEPVAPVVPAESSAEALAATGDASVPVEAAPELVEETPAPVEETPASAEKVPVPADDAPAATEDTPAPTGETKEAPAPTEEVSASTELPPELAEGAPVAIEAPSASAEDSPAIPAATALPPPAVVAPAKSAKPPKPAKQPKPAKPPKAPQTSSRRKRRRWPFVIGIVVLAIALLTAGTATAGAYFFNSHVNPGVEFQGESLVGLNRAQVEEKVAAAVEAYQVRLTRGDATVEARADDLGVTFDQAAMVEAIMNPPREANVFDDYSPWKPKPVPLILSVDRAVLQQFLDEQFIDDSERQVPAGVTYNEGTAHYAVIPSVTGTVGDAEPVARALEASEGMAEPLEISTKPEPPLITDAAAQETVDAANQRIDAPLVFRAGEAAYTIPPTSVGYWLTLTPDADAGTVTLGYDTKSITAQVPEMLNANLATPPVNEEIMYGPDGQRLGRFTKGVNGTVLADPAGVSAQAASAVQTGGGLDAEVELVTAEFVTEDVPMQAEYLEENGAKWVDVNLSNYTATAYNGTTVFGQSKVVTGAARNGGIATRIGMFHVYLKLDRQDMDGLNSDGTKWEVKNVPWIAYFDGGIALHGAYWRSSFGYADSHGCVNMPVSFAKKIYDWIEIGTLVVVRR